MVKNKRKFSFIKKKNKKEDAVESKIAKKMVNAFDDWARKNKKLVLKKDKISEIYWYDELLDVVKKKSSIRAFLNSKNRKLRQEFIDDATSVHIEIMVNCYEEINKYENVICLSEEIIELMTKFESHILKLIKYYPKKKENEVREFLLDYVNSGSFKKESIEKLRFEVDGVWGNIIYFIKRIVINSTLYGMVDEYSKNNLYFKIWELYRKPYGIDFWYMLSSKLGVICNLDFNSSVKWGVKLDKKIAKIKRFIINEEKLAEKKKLVIEGIEKSFDCSDLVVKEEEIMMEYIKENFNR